MTEILSDELFFTARFIKALEISYTSTYYFIIWEAYYLIERLLRLLHSPTNHHLLELSIYDLNEVKLF